MSTLPPLSLSNANKIPAFGVKTIEQIYGFLEKCAFVKETHDDEGSKLCSELLLLISVQRGSLSLLLDFIKTSLSICKNENGLESRRRLDKDLVDSAASMIHQCTGVSGIGQPHFARYELACQVDPVQVELYEAVLFLSSEVCFVNFIKIKILWI